MGSLSSNGKAVTKKRPLSSGGGFFTRREDKHRAFMWAEVDGTLLRMTLDALTYRGWGLAFFLANGGRGMKVRVYAEGPPSDAIVLDAGEMNGLLQWILDDMRSGDEELQAIFEEVSTWLENRDR